MKRYLSFIAIALTSVAIPLCSYAASPIGGGDKKQHSKVAAPVSKNTIRHRVTDNTVAYTPLRYIDDANASSRRSKTFNQAATKSVKSQPAIKIAEADPNAVYPDLHASVTSYYNGNRSSRVAKLPTKMGEDFTTKKDYVMFNWGGVEVNRNYYGVVHQHAYRRRHPELL